MNKQEYNNVIETTLAQQTGEKDSLQTTREVLNNMGVVLPQGNLQQVSEGLATDDYMGWRKCTVKEAQEFANEGTAVVAISNEQIALVAANDDDGEVAATSAAVMTLDENTSALAVADTIFYANSRARTTDGPSNSGIYFKEKRQTKTVGWTGYCQVPSNCSIMMTNFMSSNPQVASIEYVSGIITAHQVGTTTITAVTTDGYSASYTLVVSALTIYQTPTTFREDASGNLAEDLKYNDMTVEQLKELSWINWSDFVLDTPQGFLSTWVNMVAYNTIGDPIEMTPVILDMIQHFMSGYGTDYTNDVLKQKVLEHDSTQQYINNVKSRVEALVSENSGDISKLEYDVSKRTDCLLVQRMNGVTSPVYNTGLDTICGLRICLDSLWGNEVRVKSFQKNGNSFSGVLTFVLYDHFGLDANDVSSYGFLAGFRAWYILQHNKEYNGAYKPFLTYIMFDVPFGGTY